jgi:adenylate cyclase
MPFGQVQCADLAGWAGKTDAAGWRKAVESIGALCGNAPAAASAVQCAPQGEPLLAVLAFDNLSGDAEMAYFSDGVSEEILQTVARGAELKVIGRGSSFQFRGADKAAAHVARALKATHVLDGSVRRSGNKVRIAANLIECTGETTLWSDRFDRELSDVFALQDEIAAAVAASLRSTFAPTEGRRIDPEAYDLYLRALATISDDASAEIRLLEKVVALAPDFAPAWAQLSTIRSGLGRYNSPDGITEAEWALAADEAQRAIRLDPRAGQAWAALSSLEPYGAYAKREGLIERGLSQARNDPALLGYMSGFCAHVGRRTDALRFAEQAYQLDPLQPGLVNGYAGCLAVVGEHARAMQLFATARSRWPDAEVFAVTAMQECAFLGDWAAYDEIAKQVRAKGSPTLNERQALSVGRALREPNDVIRQRVRGSLEAELAASGSIGLGPLVFAYRLGLRDEVFELVDRSSFDGLFDPRGRAPGGWYSASVLFSPITDLRHDPRFVRLCAKLAFCGYWVDTGHWPDCAEAGVLPYDFKAECRRLATA